jgi:hypothetical protein
MQSGNDEVSLKATCPACQVNRRYASDRLSSSQHSTADEQSDDLANRDISIRMGTTRQANPDHALDLHGR